MPWRTSRTCEAIGVPTPENSRAGHSSKSSAARVALGSSTTSRRTRFRRFLFTSSDPRCPSYHAVAQRSAMSCSPLGPERHSCCDRWSCLIRSHPGTRHPDVRRCRPTNLRRSPPPMDRSYLSSSRPGNNRTRCPAPRSAHPRHTDQTDMTTRRSPSLVRPYRHICVRDDLIEPSRS